MPENGPGDVIFIFVAAGQLSPPVDRFQNMSTKPALLPGGSVTGAGEALSGAGPVPPWWMPAIGNTTLAAESTWNVGYPLRTHVVTGAFLTSITMAIRPLAPLSPGFCATSRARHVVSGGAVDAGTVAEGAAVTVLVAVGEALGVFGPVHEHAAATTHATIANIAGTRCLMWPG